MRLPGGDPLRQPQGKGRKAPRWDVPKRDNLKAFLILVLSVPFPFLPSLKILLEAVFHSPHTEGSGFEVN